MGTVRYEVEYIDEEGAHHYTTVIGVGLSEALDTFIEEYCPVHSIVCVRKVGAA
jgi:hypothetical protein